MGSIDSILETSVLDGDLPFAVAMVGTAEGVTHSCAVGDAAPGVKAAEDTVFRIYSMTKAVCSTAAMILIDRGRLDPETPVEDIIPRFGHLQVIDRFEKNVPILRAPRSKATVRHLATHTSGLAYEFWNQDVPRYIQTTGHPTVLTGLKAGLNFPMITDPGTRWEYGPNTDWLGQVVEAVDGRRIDVFLHDELFGPLAMKDTDVEVRDDMRNRLAAISARNEDGTFGPFDMAPPSQPEFYGMGHALYSTAPDYMRFLRMFLNRGSFEGERILSAEAVERMLRDHMNGLAMTRMTTAAPAITADFHAFPGTRVTHSFGFMRNEEDIPGRRSAGSQSWAGVLNTHYWFDPQKDVAGILLSQSLPFVEPRYMKSYEAFEKAVYRQISG